MSFKNDGYFEIYLAICFVLFLVQHPVSNVHTSFDALMATLNGLIQINGSYFFHYNCNFKTRLRVRRLLTTLKHVILETVCLLIFSVLHYHWFVLF